MYSVRDEAVLRAKISWYQNELLGQNAAQSSHPIVRVLHKSGAIKQDDVDVHRHFLSILHRIELDPPDNGNEFKSLCIQTSRFASCLELGVTSERVDEVEGFSSACALVGFVQLLRESSRVEPTSFAWVPLNLFARHQITRRDWMEQPESRQARDLFEELCETVLSWFPPAKLEKLKESAAQAGMEQERLNHWMMQLNLQVHLLNSLSRMGLAKLKHQFLKTTPAFVWRNWQFARKLKWA